MRSNIIQKFLQLESAGGIILFIAAVAALILSNSHWDTVYQHWFKSSHLFWINEGLMALFFLLIGLELKREFWGGEIPFSQIFLPSGAALGGMIIPALIYLSINSGNLVKLNGWAIPVATDIAFALGVLSLFGKRVPLSLKLFLMALAIFDDLGAIFIIAIFHSKALSYISLLFAAVIIIALFMLQHLKIKSLAPYLLLGFMLWLSVSRSGIHATVAGVLLALFIPLDENEKKSPAHRLQNAVHPWVAYFVLPLFAFANSGLSFLGVSYHTLMDSITLGIILGLFLGKQIGVFFFSWLIIRCGWAKLPHEMHWLELYGVAILCGIGFTMSLFLGTLAFQGSHEFLTEVKLGVLGASILSGIVGTIVLNHALPKRKR